MKNWTLEHAAKDLGEVARRALAHHPQRIELDGREAVVVLNAADYATLAFARDLIDFVRRSTAPAVVREPEVDRPQSQNSHGDVARLEDP